MSKSEGRKCHGSRDDGEGQRRSASKLDCSEEYNSTENSGSDSDGLEFSNTEWEVLPGDVDSKAVGRVLARYVECCEKQLIVPSSRILGLLKSRVSVFDVSDTHLRDRGIQALAKTLIELSVGKITRLTQLLLASTFPQRKGLELLATALPKLKSLRILVVDRNALGAQGGSIFARVLRDMRQLVKFSASENGKGFGRHLLAGWQSFGIPTNESGMMLEDISLRKCGLDRTPASLCAVMSNMSRHIQRVDIGWNSITNEGAQELLQPQSLVRRLTHLPTLLGN